MIFSKRKENPYRESIEVIIIGFIVFLALVWFEVSTLDSTKTIWFIALIYNYGGKWLVGGAIWALGLLGVFKATDGLKAWMAGLFTLSAIAALFLFQYPIAFFISELQGKDGIPKVFEQDKSNSELNYRILEDQKGREIEAAILDYNGYDLVRIQRRDGEVFTTSISVYSSSDQAYIRKKLFQQVGVSNRFRWRSSIAHPRRWTRIMKLDHIQLAMPKGEEEMARSFFGDILGMNEEEKPYPLSERGGCWFRKGSVSLHIGVDKDFSAQKKAHPAFLVSNLNELEKKLKEKDFEVVWDEALPNRIRFYSSDPFGNRIEFLKDGDGFSQK